MPPFVAYLKDTMDKSDDPDGPGDFTLPTPIPYFHSAKPALPGARHRVRLGARPAGLTDP